MIAAALGGLGCGAGAALVTPLARRYGVQHLWHVILATLLGAGAGSLGTAWPHAFALGAAAVGCSLLVVVDAATHRLPRAILIPTYGAVVPLLVLSAYMEGSWNALGRAALGALAMGLFYLVLGLISPGGIGFGDVTFAPLLGLLLGWYGWPHVVAGTVAGFVAAALAAIVLMILRRATSTTRLAFGPWMVAGAVLALATL